MCKSTIPPKFEAIEGLHDVAYTNMGMIDSCTFLLDFMKLSHFSSQSAIKRQSHLAYCISGKSR